VGRRGAARKRRGNRTNEGEFRKKTENVFEGDWGEGKARMLSRGKTMSRLFEQEGGRKGEP